MDQVSYRDWRARLYDMKRDWLSFIADAELRGDLDQADIFRAQLEDVLLMIERAGGDSSLNPPRRTNA
jgi:hypothetical protein